jgi:pilus assembly protein Flp/PilA
MKDGSFHQITMAEVNIMTFLKMFLRDESGATAIEYGLIAAILGVGLLLSLGNLKDSYVALYQRITNGLNS